MIRTLPPTLLIAVILASPAPAEEANWIKYLEGTWTRDTEIKTKVGVEKTILEWTGKLASGGKAVILSGNVSNGKEQARFVGLQSSGKGVFEHGIDSTGLTWTITYTEVSANRMKGKIEAVLGDGTPGNGTMVLEKQDKGYIAAWKVTLENEDRDVIEGKGVNIRD